MNHRICLLVCAILWIILPSQAIANNQGLMWAIDEEFSLEITLTSLSVAESEGDSTYHSDLLSEHLLVTIIDLPEIPDDVDSLPTLSAPPGVYLPRPAFELTRVNETTIPIGWEVIWNIMIGRSLVTIPAGNWALLSDIVNGHIQSNPNPQVMQIELIDTSTRWGWKHSITSEGHFGIVERAFFKVDGTLAMYHTNETIWDEHPDIGLYRETEDIVVERLNGPSETPFPILEVVLGVGVVSIVVVVILMKYRSR